MIKKLTAENVRKIKFIEIEPDGTIVKLKGRNAQGKTSVIDAIMMCLGGARQIGENPIRDGQTSGQVILETDNYKIERNIYKSKYGEIKTNLIIYDRKGNLIKRPQTFLNELLGDAIVDPDTIIHKTPGERINILKTAFGINFDELDDERGRIFYERADRKKNEKLLTGQLKAYQHLPERPQTARTADEILKDIERAEVPFQRERDAKRLQETERKRIQELNNERDGFMQEINGGSIAIEGLEKKKRELEELAQNTRERVNRAERNLEKVMAAIEVESKKISKGYVVTPDHIARMDGLKAELKKSALIEKETQEINLRDKIHRDREAERKKVGELGRAIDDIDNKKKDILKKVQFPIEGMSFGDHDILFNGIPFSSCSCAEQIRLAVGIMSKISTNIKFMKISDASVLDNNSVKEIEKILAESGIQGWLEFVDSEGEAGAFIIEEGGCDGKTA